MQWSRVVGAVVVSLVLGSGGVACGDDSDDGSATGSDVPGQQFDSPWQLVGDVPLDYELSLAVVDGTAVVVGRGPDDTLGAHYSDDGYVWEPAVGLESLEIELALDMAGGEQGFVAVSAGDLTPPDEPVVVFSADGSSWERIPPEDLPAAEVAWLTDVVAGPDGFVAVGDAGDPEFGATVWFSGDGRNWVDTDLPALDGPVAVANNGDTWMAVGGPGARPTDPARVFTSVDGMRWVEVDAQNPPPIGGHYFVADSETWLLGATRIRPVVDGEYSGNLYRPWVSTDDGDSWSEGAWSDSPDVVGLDLLSGVAVAEDGFVVVGRMDGSVGPGTQVAFFSEDGSSWELQRPVSDFVGLDVLGEEIIALDSYGNIFLRSP